MILLFLKKQKVELIKKLAQKEHFIFYLKKEFLIFTILFRNKCLGLLGKLFHFYAHKIRFTYKIIDDLAASTETE